MAQKKPAKKPAKAQVDRATRRQNKKEAESSKDQGLAELPRRDRIEHVMAAVNKSMGGPVVQRASKSNSSYLLRRPTGIISLDIKLAGGLPASAPSVIVGSDGVGKDYLLWRMCAEVQRLYGDEFALAVYLTEFKADKLFMKDKCGLQVGLTEDELDELNAARVSAGQEEFSDAQLAHYRNQIGEILIIDGVTAEHGFDALIEFVASNACQIVAINSIGFLQTDAKEDTDTFSEYAIRSSEAVLMGKFLPKLAMILNRGFVGERNETALIMINQVRSKEVAPRAMPGRQVQEKDKYRAALQAWSLKHGIAIQLMLHKGQRIYDEELGEYLGREVNWELNKGKLGTHDGIKGSYIYYYDTGADTLADLINTCMELNVFQRNTSWVSCELDAFEFKVQGVENIRRLVIENPDVVPPLREACLRSAGVVYRHH